MKRIRGMRRMCKTQQLIISLSLCYSQKPLHRYAGSRKNNKVIRPTRIDFGARTQIGSCPLFVRSWITPSAYQN